MDEFSMIGFKILNFINVCLKESTCNNRPFGAVNVIAMGDLYQLKPVKDGYIFQPLQCEYGSLATNLWIEYFWVYELTEIMWQRNDKMFAEI